MLEGVVSHNKAPSVSESLGKSRVYLYILHALEKPKQVSTRLETQGLLSKFLFEYCL